MFLGFFSKFSAKNEPQMPLMILINRVLRGEICKICEICGFFTAEPCVSGCSVYRSLAYHPRCPLTAP